MKSDQLFINDRQIELYPETVIGITYQINDISELKDRQADFSNQFKVPKSQKNIEALGWSSQVQSFTTLPYRKLKAVVLKNGVQVMPKAYAIIESTEKDFNVTVYSGNKNFFESIEGKMLSDLDLSSMDHTFDFATVTGSRTNTEAQGYKYSMVDFNTMDDISRNKDVRNMRPSIFCVSLLRQIITEAGFTFAGSIFTNPNFLKTLIPYCTNDPGTPYFDTLGVGTFNGWKLQSYSSVPAPDSFVTIANGETWNYSIRIKFTINTWTDGFSSYDIRIGNALLTGLAGTFTYHHPDSGGGGGVGNFDITLTASGTNTSGGPLQDYVSIKAKLAQTVYVSHEWYGTKAPGTTPDFFIHGTRNVMNATILGLLGLPGMDIGFAYGSQVYMNLMMPEMTQKDFVKSIFNQWAIILSTDNLTSIVSLNQFEDIVANIPISIDMSELMHDDQDKTKLEYRLDYARKNWLKYKEDSDDKEILKGLGNGSFLVDDETLEAEKTLFDIAFAATKMVYKMSYLYVPRIPKMDNTGAFTINTEPRMLIDDTQNVLNGDITFFDGGTIALPSGNMLTTGTDIPMCYFQLPNKSFNLGFDRSLIADNYRGVQGTLVRAKKITPWFKLDSTFISSLSHLIPVYLKKYASYFYLNKVLSYTGLGLTKMELIRLGNGDEGIPPVELRFMQVSGQLTDIPFDITPDYYGNPIGGSDTTLKPFFFEVGKVVRITIASPYLGLAAGPGVFIGVTRYFAAGGSSFEGFTTLSADILIEAGTNYTVQFGYDLSTIGDTYPSLLPQITPPAANGINGDASIICVNPTNVADYTFAWTGPGGFTASTPAINAPAGDYTCVVTYLPGTFDHNVITFHITIPVSVIGS